MRYWGYLAAKLAAAGGGLYGLHWAIAHGFPRPEPVMAGTKAGRIVYAHADPFGHDLAYTFTMLFFWLFCVGVVWAVVWDQRYRCRTCLRRLRMPVLTGSWTHILLGRPRTEYICPYGHGTLKVEELQITGRQQPDWQPHEDIWKELYSLEETKK
jgi:hypothetical protein